MINKTLNYSWRIMNKEEICKNLYRGNAWVRLFASIRFWTSSFSQLERFAPQKGRILDLGCGYGIFGNYLALCSKERKIIGVDTDTNKVENAYKGIKNTVFKVGDATEMNLKNLNAILLLDVLHHLDSYTQQEKLISDCVKMLSKSGKLIVSDVDNNPFWKLVLARLTDFVIYKGDKVYYRYQKDMFALLRVYFADIKIKKLSKNPFPHIVYICKCKKNNITTSKVLP